MDKIRKDKKLEGKISKIEDTSGGRSSFFTRA